MTRRDFIQRLSWLPLVGSFVPTFVPTAVIRPGRPPVIDDAEGQIYRLVRATNEIRAGDVVYTGTIPIGFAVARIDPRHYGYVQIRPRLDPYTGPTVWEVERRTDRQGVTAGTPRGPRCVMDPS